jgi:RNA polymerase sigma-70 factor (ECF subfamily)
VTCGEFLLDAEPSFADLLERLRLGEEGAAEEIVRRFSSQLVRLASRRVAGQLRGKIDPEDLVQSAFRSFFRKNPAETFEVSDWDGLWAVLSTITLRKCGYQVRQFRAAKRSIQREQAAPVDEHGAVASWIALAREPTPAEAAMLGDLVEQLLAGLPSQTRQIAELALLGKSAVEIAPEVGLSERSVFRQMERVRRRLDELDPKE